MYDTNRCKNLSTSQSESENKRAECYTRECGRDAVFRKQKNILHMFLQWLD